MTYVEKTDMVDTIIKPRLRMLLKKMEAQSHPTWLRVPHKGNSFGIDNVRDWETWPSDYFNGPTASSTMHIANMLWKELRE